MTYFGFLAIFLGVPIVILAVWHLLQRHKASGVETWQLNRSAALVIAIHVVIALLYTTPWDNYLVATGVWWYDPDLVTGLTLGWVPVEEYTFFVLQPIFSGLLLLALHRRLQPASGGIQGARQIRMLSTGLTAVAWLLSLAILIGGWQPGTYLALELGWALPPVMLQLAFGADVLWRHRKGVLAAVLGPTLFLSAADALAIGAGIWTINPAQSLHLFLGGVLPLEEFIFFLLTNTLIVFGVTLSMAPESRERVTHVCQVMLDAIRQLRKLGERSLRRSAEF